MRPSQYELPEIWSASARPAPTRTTPSRTGRLAVRTARTTPWVRDAASFLGTFVATFTVLLATVGLFFPSLLFAL